MKKTIEHIEKRDIDSINNLLTISTVAGLPKTDALEDETLFEVSVKDLLTENYTSKSVKWSKIMDKMQSSSFEYFNAAYKTLRWDSLKPKMKDLPEGKDTTIWRFLMQEWKGPVSGGNASLEATTSGAPAPRDGAQEETFSGQETNQVPYVWGDVWTLAVGELVLDKWLKGVDERVEVLETTRIALNDEMGFKTRLSRFQTDSGETKPADEDDPVSQETMASAYHNINSPVNSDGFVVAFYKKNKLSSTFTCPCDGLLSLYGWVDSSNVADVKYLPSAWCALKAKIKGSWEIVQIQPVAPARQFSYVGFCVPVTEGLQIQLELGFIPAGGSGRYDRTKMPESLANTQPNAFLGGVYDTSGKKSSTENP